MFAEFSELLCQLPAYINCFSKGDDKHAYQWCWEFVYMLSFDAYAFFLWWQLLICSMEFLPTGCF